MNLTKNRLACAGAVLLLVLSAGEQPGSAHSARTIHAACPRPTDPIAIQSIGLSSNSIQTGRPVTGTIVATCNVAAMTARVGTYQIGVPKVAPGLFRTTIVVPPVVFPGRYVVVFTAIRTDGATLSKNISVEVHW
jgi:hypothetical protein